ncbi:MAG: hypothetical protein JXR70_09615 [Spirochaetales bacterium]|nr:hypothetical protein [Spirochaetales bacterium]
MALSFLWLLCALNKAKKLIWHNLIVFTNKSPKTVEILLGRMDIVNPNEDSRQIVNPNEDSRQ